MRRAVKSTHVYSPGTRALVVLVTLVLSIVIGHRLGENFLNATVAEHMGALGHDSSPFP